jgi:hypothetical protein
VFLRVGAAVIHYVLEIVRAREVRFGHVEEVILLDDFSVAVP